MDGRGGSFVVGVLGEPITRLISTGFPPGQWRHRNQNLYSIHFQLLGSMDQAYTNALQIL